MQINISTGIGEAQFAKRVLGRPIAYGGDDPSGFEQNLAIFVPRWTAYETRLIAECYVSNGMIPEAGDVERGYCFSLRSGFASFE